MTPIEVCAGRQNSPRHRHETKHKRTLVHVAPVLCLMSELCRKWYSCRVDVHESAGLVFPARRIGCIASSDLASRTEAHESWAIPTVVDRLIQQIDEATEVEMK